MWLLNLSLFGGCVVLCHYFNLLFLSDWSDWAFSPHWASIYLFLWRAYLCHLPIDLLACLFTLICFHSCCILHTKFFFFNDYMCCKYLLFSGLPFSTLLRHVWLSIVPNINVVHFIILFLPGPCIFCDLFKNLYLLKDNDDIPQTLSSRNFILFWHLDSQSIWNLILYVVWD